MLRLARSRDGRAMASAGPGQVGRAPVRGPGRPTGGCDVTPGNLTLSGGPGLTVCVLGLVCCRSASAAARPRRTAGPMKRRSVMAAAAAAAGVNFNTTLSRRTQTRIRAAAPRLPGLGSHIQVGSASDWRLAETTPAGSDSLAPESEAESPPVTVSDTVWDSTWCGTSEYNPTSEMAPESLFILKHTKFRYGPGI